MEGNEMMEKMTTVVDITIKNGGSLVKEETKRGKA